MIEIIFIILAGVYFVVALKVKSWATISALGFNSETPMLFVKNRGAYYFFELLLFVSALAVSFNSLIISWHSSLIVLVVLWFFVWFYGQKKGFAKYREILQEMMLSADTKEKREEYRKESQKTDIELRELIQSLNLLR